MKNNSLALCFVLFQTMMLWSQSNDLSLSNSMFLPFAQQSEVNYDQYESGLISMKNSSYFLGLTYRKEFSKKKWAFKFSFAVGEEHYNIHLYNELIDFEQNPKLAIDFDKPYADFFHQTNISSFELEKRFNLPNKKYQVSVFGGLYINNSHQIPQTHGVSHSNYPYEENGTSYTAYDQMVVYPPKKFGIGLSTGVSIRRFLYKNFYIEFLAQALFRNTFEYRYDLNYRLDDLTGGTPSQTYSANNQGNRIDYSLIGFNLNLGIVW